MRTVLDVILNLVFNEILSYSQFGILLLIYFKASFTSRCILLLDCDFL